MKKFCEACNKEVNTLIIEKKEVYSVLGEKIEVNAKILTCAECGEELFCEELDNNTLLDAYNKYRIKHKLLFPKEIKQIRELYGLSQTNFAKLLNWGDKTIHRYENGSIQDKAHNTLLQFLRDPKNMKSYLKENDPPLDPKLLMDLSHRVDNLIENFSKTISDNIDEYLFSSPPSIKNGFKEFEYCKFAAMVTFFANKNSELLKTKLMKLLNYSDMIFFKENGISISGLQYIHYPYGPVPVNFEILLEKLTVDKIAHIEIDFMNSYEKHRVIADSDAFNTYLNEKELQVLERINNKFESYGSKEISDYSHKEKGYTSTSLGETISYDYASYIQL